MGSFFLFKEGVQCKWREGIYKEIENDKQYNSKFLKLWESTDVELAALNQYFTSHPEIFEEYFKYHCPNTNERLSNAIKQYPAKIEDIRIITKTLPIIIQEVTNAYHNKFNFDVK